MLDYCSGTKPSLQPLKLIYFSEQYTKISQKSKIQAEVYICRDVRYNATKLPINTVNRDVKHGKFSKSTLCKQST